MLKFLLNKKKQKPIESFIFNYKSKSNLLNTLCKKFGCDKGYFEGSQEYFSWAPHSYTDLYYFLFSNQRKSIKSI